MIEEKSFWFAQSAQVASLLHKKPLMGTSQCNRGGALDALPPPSRKSLLYLKEYEKQSKLYVDINSTPVLALFSKTWS